MALTIVEIRLHTFAMLGVADAAVDADDMDRELIRRAIRYAQSDILLLADRRQFVSAIARRLIEARTGGAHDAHLLKHALAARGIVFDPE